jgi:RNA polymerase sigma-70 factor (ECF subfamily)
MTSNIPGSLLPHAKDLERFHKLYSKELFAHAMSILKSEEAAKDMVQEGFIKLYNSTNHFSSDKEVSNFLHTVVANIGNDIYRHAKVKNTHANSLQEDALDPYDQEELLAVERLTWKRLELIYEEIKKLSVIRQRIMAERYLQQKSIREIANLHGIDDKTVSNHLWYARRQIKKALNMPPKKSIRKMILFMLSTLS